jgi:hypothetical protein
LIAVLATLVLGSQRCHPHCRIAGAYRLALGIGSLRLQVSISVKILPLLLVFRGWEWVGIASLEMKMPDCPPNGLYTNSAQIEFRFIG